MPATHVAKNGKRCGAAVIVRKRDNTFDRFKIFQEK